MTEPADPTTGYRSTFWWRLYDGAAQTAEDEVISEHTFPEIAGPHAQEAAGRTDMGDIIGFQPWSPMNVR